MKGGRDEGREGRKKEKETMCFNKKKMVATCGVSGFNLCESEPLKKRFI